MHSPQRDLLIPQANLRLIRVDIEGWQFSLVRQRRDFKD